MTHRERWPTARERWPTARERWLAAINMQPVDRLPFWPKLDDAYGRHQREPFRSMSNDELHTWIGSDPHVGIPDIITEKRTCTSVESVTDDDVKRTFYRAPSGELTLVQRYDEASASWHPTEFPVKTREDVLTMTAVYEDATPELDRDKLEASRAEARRIGESAATAMGIGESPLMWFVEYLAGIEGAHFLLTDYRDDVETLFDAVHRNILRRAEIIGEYGPADLLYMVENTSTTLISPAQYRTYCFRHLSEYAEIIRAAGKNMVLHMCGHLKDLLPDLAKLPVKAFEAFTSPPVGNTFLEDGRAACPDVCLIGGTDAALWLRPARDIIAHIERSLDALPHHRGIVVTSAGVQPPPSTPETIREVCQWVQGYRVKM